MNLKGRTGVQSRSGSDTESSISAGINIDSGCVSTRHGYRLYFARGRRLQCTESYGFF